MILKKFNNIYRFRAKALVMITIILPKNGILYENRDID